MKSKKKIKKRIAMFEKELTRCETHTARATMIAVINNLEWCLEGKKWRRFLSECPAVVERK